MKPFKHYILTRYNLYLYQQNPYKVEDLDSWMRSRVPLFKRFIKSLMEQTVNDFTLVLSMDEATPEHYYNQVVSLLDASKLEYVIHFDKKPKDFVINSIHSTTWIITSRCDSDDTLEPEFVETIQGAFNYQEECLDVRGYKHDGKDYYRYARKQVGSPFVSVIETTEGEIKTSAYKKHSDMRKFFFNRFVGNKPLFVQHIHGGNVINSIRGEEKTVKI
jgi:hypothetical protein